MASMGACDLVRLSAWSALLAAATAVGVGELVAAFVRPAASPVIAVGNRVITLTPESAKEGESASSAPTTSPPAHRHLPLAGPVRRPGRHAGLAARPRPGRGGGVRGDRHLLRADRPGPSTGRRHPDDRGDGGRRGTLVGCSPRAAGGELGRSLRSTAGPAPGRRPPRRLRRSPASAAGPRSMRARLRPRARSALRCPRRRRQRRPCRPAPISVRAQCPCDTERHVLPGRHRTHLPEVDPDTWTLRIHGMVDRELTLRYSELVGAAAHRAVDHAVLRLERGRRRPDRQRAVPRRPARRRAPRGGLHPDAISCW